jgi:hypothetical protein
MAQLSRPYQIALGVLVLFAAVWFIALRGSSTNTSGSGSSPAASAPAAATPTNSGSTAAAEAKAAAAPTPIYHGAAPGVEGLTRAINKAHGAVATSQQNARQLEEKSAQASSTQPTTSITPTAKHPAATSTKANTHVAGESKAVEAQTGPQRTPARQALVERTLKEGKIAVILFWNPKGADDVATRDELLLLEAVHHIIRPVAGLPRVRSLLAHSGLELQKTFAVFVARENQVTSFGSITRAIQVYQTPTILIINKHGLTRTLSGLTDAYSLEQAIDEARHA